MNNMEILNSNLEGVSATTRALSIEAFVKKA